MLSAAASMLLSLPMIGRLLLLCLTSAMCKTKCVSGPCSKHRHALLPVMHCAL